MVILSDYIRKEFFINAPENTLELNKIGIIPIFEKLRRNNTDQKKIGVLTGSIIIIPSTAFPLFSKLAQEIGIVNINSSLVPYDEKYVLIHPSEQLKNSIIKLITQIFQEGEIEILIGTKSLLGEGWDAPAINSLVMASFVGSFVLSNQMRGRAIRTQKGNLGKTSNIWHLATIDQTADNGGDDFEVLKRRFRSFVGVSFKDKPGIENGIGRLNIPANIHLKEELEKKNEEMFAFAGDRESLAKRWKTALDSGNILIEEIKIPFSEKRKYNSVKSLYLNKTIANLVATLVSGIFAFGGQSLEILGQILRHLNTSQVVFYLSVIGIVGTFIFGRLTLKTLRLFLKYRDISKDIQQIGVALVNSLREAKIVNTVSSALKVNSSIDEWGSVYCHLEGATTFEKSTFISSLQEIISPIDNPRYVIIRKNSFMLLLEKKDYHSVPEVLGKNKRLAEHFESQWSKHVGKCELIFTRTIMGRKALLKSRAKALASQFEDKIEHVNKWR